MASPANQNVSIPITSSYTYVSYNSQGVYQGSWGPYTLDTSFGKQFRYILTIGSVTTPNYWRLRKWNRPVNPYTKYVLEYVGARGTMVQKAKASAGNWSIYTYSSNMDYMFGSLPRDVTLAVEDQTQKVFNKLRDQISQQKASAAVSLAEFDKTAKHVAHTATRIYKALKALKSGHYRDFTSALGMSYTTRDVRYFNKQFNKAKTFKNSSRNYNATYTSDRMMTSGARNRTTDFLADTWLEYSYGWKPLLKDVYDMAAATAEIFVERNREWRYVTARASDSRSFNTENKNTCFLIKNVTISRKWTAMGVTFKIPEVP